MKQISEEDEKEQINQKLSSNVIVSLLVNLIYLFTRLFIPPYILSYLPLTEYGIWSYCFILISYVSIGVFGVTNVYIRYISIYFAHREMDKINKLVSTGVIIVSGFSILVLIALWYLLPILIPIMSIPPELSQMAFILFFGTVLIQIIDMTLGVYNYILQGIQKIGQERLIWGFSFLIETVLIVVLLKSGFGVYSLLVAYFMRILLAIFFYAIYSYKYLPELSILPKYFDKSFISYFINFGGIVQLSSMFALINRSFEKVVSGKFLGVKTTALYEVGEKFPIMALLIPGTINAVLLPTTSHLHAKEKRDHILEVYLKSSRLINILTGLMMGYMTSFAPGIIRCWLGLDEKFSVAATILAFFSPAYQMDVLTGPLSALYRSMEKPLRELVYNAGQFILVLLGLVALFYYYGASIMTINIAVVSMMILSVIIYLILGNSYLNVSQWDYFKSVVIPGFIPYIFGYLLSRITQPWFLSVYNDRWSILLYLAVNLLIYCIVTFLYFYFFCISENEKKQVAKFVFNTLKF